MHTDMHTDRHTDKHIDGNTPLRYKIHYWQLDKKQHFASNEYLNGKN